MTVVTTEFTPCKADPELWFSEESSDILEAKDRCLDCPIFFACREAGQDQPYGVWGGMSREERLVEFPEAMRRAGEAAEKTSEAFDKLALSLRGLEEEHELAKPGEDFVMTEEHEKVAALYGTGMGEGKIAKAMGRGNRWVRVKLQEMRAAGIEGVEPRSKARWNEYATRASA